MLTLLIFSSFHAPRLVIGEQDSWQPPRILSLRRLGQQIPDPHQVVRSHHPQEVLPYSSQTSELCLSQSADLLGPTEGLFNAFGSR